MRKYEAIIIMNPDLGEGQVKDEGQKLQAILEANGAREIQLTNWGRKPVAHKIGKNKNCFFLSYNFVSSESTLIDKTNSQLRISDAVSKFQINRINEKVRKFKGTIRKVSEFESDFEVPELAGLDY